MSKDRDNFCSPAVLESQQIAFDTPVHVTLALNLDALLYTVSYRVDTQSAVTGSGMLSPRFQTDAATFELRLEAGTHTIL